MKLDEITLRKAEAKEIAVYNFADAIARFGLIPGIEAFGIKISFSLRYGEDKIEWREDNEP